MIERKIAKVFFKLDLDILENRNAFYLVIEIFWASFLNAAASFNSAYAIRLGSDNVQVGLLSSLPALFAVLVSIPAGQILQSKSNRRPWLMAAISANRGTYLIIALVPFFNFLGLPPGPLTVGLIALSTLPSHFFNVGWTPMLAEVTTPESRVGIFSARNIIYNASYSLSTFLMGLWLSQSSFPFNYQVIYFIGFLTSCMSTYYICKIQTPPPATARTQVNISGNSLSSLVKMVRTAFIGHPGFSAITRNTLMHGMGVWMASPLYTIYFIKSLNADNSWIGLQGTILSVATIAGYTIWRRLMKRLGEPLTLKITILCAGLYPLLVGNLNSLTLILFAVVLNGIISSGINLSHFNTLLKVTPEDNRPGFTALYNTIMNVGAFVMPLIGVSIANWIGAGPALIFCGLLCIAGSSSFWFWPVKSETITAS